MIKKDIVNKLHESSLCYRMSKKHVGQLVTEVFNIITQALIENEDVQLRGFGHFKPQYRPPRDVQHPGTGKKVVTPPRYAILFNPAKNVKRELILAEPKSIQEEVEHG